MTRTRAWSYPLLVLVLCVVLLPASAPHALAAVDRESEGSAVSAAHAELPRWKWPLSGMQAIAVPYRAPAHEFGSGHRGVDIGAAVGAEVTAPAGGIVAFRGTVVDRPLITIQHPGGLVSTLEPVMSQFAPGDAVAAGQSIGTVSTGGHAAIRTMHLGVRLDGEYINPMLLFGPIERSILLPCCD